MYVIYKSLITKLYTLTVTTLCTSMKQNPRLKRQQISSLQIQRRYYDYLPQTKYQTLYQQSSSITDVNNIVTMTF